MADETIDKAHLYGRYQGPTDARAAVDVDRLKWQNQLQKQLAHKALDEPFVDQQDMNLNVRRGMGWPELSVCGGICVALCTTVIYVTRPSEPAPAPAPYNYIPPVHVPTEHVPTPHVPQQRTEPPHTHSDRDTLMVPRLRFGPER